MSRNGFSLDESVTGLEVVGLHCIAQKELEAESWGFLGSLWEESEGCRGTLYIALSSIVGWKENTMTCHVKAYKEGECQ